MNETLRIVSVKEMKEFTQEFLVSELIENKNSNFTYLTDVTLKSISKFFNMLLEEKTYPYVKTFLEKHVLEIYVKDMTVSSLLDIVDMQVDLHNRRLLIIIAIMIEEYSDKLSSSGVKFNVKLIENYKFFKFNEILLGSIDYLEHSKQEKTNINKIKILWDQLNPITFTDKELTVNKLLNLKTDYDINKQLSLHYNQIEPFTSYHTLTLTCPICKQKHKLENGNKHSLIQKVSGSDNLYFLFCKHTTRYDNNRLKDIERIDLKSHKNKIDKYTEIADFIIYNFNILKEEIIKKFERFEKKNNIDEQIS